MSGRALRNAAGLLGDLGGIVLLAWIIPLVILAVITPLGLLANALMALLHRL